MKYRVTIDVSFDAKEDAIKLLNLVEGMKVKCVESSVNSSPELSMPKTSCIHECRHDEVPSAQCSNYEYVNFKNVNVKDWK